MKIAVIGAGTTAILAIAAIKAKFKSAEITQFADGGETIGVGEATIPETTAFMDSIGLTPVKLIKDCNASFKTGVKFENWARGNIWFPFGFTGANFRNMLNQDISSGICDYLRGSKHNYPVGMHFNTQKLQSLEFNGVSKICKKITEGDISALIGEFDVICDCSGFNPVFKPETAKDSIIEQLTNNQAHVIWIPHIFDEFAGGSTFKCYSTFYAADKGWIWHIPTQETLGIGYVHNSNGDIEAEFSGYLNRRFGVKRPQFKVINFKNHASLNPYRTENKCKILNLGLGSCFIEPIQSTGLYLTALGIELGMSVIAGEITERDANFKLLKEFEGVSAFVAANLKYCQRDTRYWNKFKKIELTDERICSSSVFTKEDTMHLHKSLKAGHTILDNIEDLDITGAIDFKTLHNAILQGEYD